MRLIDADAFADFIQQTISECNYSKLKLDRCLTVADVLQSVIDELKGEALGGFKNCPTIETCEEAVSRQSILDKTHALQEELMSNEDSKWSRNKLAYKYIAYVNGILIREPAVTLGRKRGKWIVKHNISDDSHTINCSCCEYKLITVINKGFTEKEAFECIKHKIKNYCPNCGADMREVEG